MATSKTSHKSSQPKSSKPRARRGSGTMQFLTQDELKRLFAIITNRRDKALFLLAYRHGLRASEIGHLQRTVVTIPFSEGREQGILDCFEHFGKLKPPPEGPEGSGGRTF